MTIPAPELSPGTVLDGHTIGAKVRTRSGAATYAATTATGAHVHLTVYAAECFPTTLVRERSLRELRQLQSVDAPEVAKILGFGKFEESGIYEVNEVVEGQTLAEVGQLSRAEAGATMDAVGNALLAAQKAGVIHRNLGPNAVLGTARGIKVIGFTVGEPQGGAAYGSLDAIAPEQVTGKVVDQRTLIYNLAAVAHQVLTGGPLFEGTPEQKLDLHANREAASTDAALKRALSKDARMRPMMLKQFLGELAKLGGDAAPAATAAPAAAKPSTRGWTMFMEAQEAAADPMPAPTPAAAPAPAPTPSAPAPVSSAPAPMPSAPAPAPAPMPSAPAPAPVAAKPSTRGWTMFMDAEESAAPAGAPAPAPAPMAPAPASVAPAPSMPAPAPAPSMPTPAPAPAAKPSTRGWTMFMDAAEEGAAPAAPAPAAPAPVAAPVAPAPSTPAPVPASVVAPVPAPAPSTPAPAPAGAKPSTRGWTMFMEAETGAGEAAPVAPAPAPAPAPVEQLPVTPPAPAPASAPSTRGWTMFMEADVPSEPAAPAPAPEPQPTEDHEAEEAQGPVSGASDAKGWTVFMERQPIAPPPGYTGPMPSYAPTAAELATTVEHSAQPSLEQPAQPSQPVQPYAAPPAAEQQQPGVGKQTVIMERAPDIQPSREASGSSVPASSTPAIEAGGPQSQQPRPYVPAPITPSELDRPPSKMPIYVGVAVIAIILIVLIIIAVK
jgi:hypothetical protein